MVIVVKSFYYSKDYKTSKVHKILANLGDNTDFCWFI